MPWLFINKARATETVALFCSLCTRPPTRQSLDCKDIIQKHSKDFGGTLEDSDVILSISLISNRFSSKNTLRLYFGAKTMWYLQFRDVCAKMLLSMLSFFIDNPPYHKRRIFSHRLTSNEARDYSVVFVIQ